MPTLSGIKVTDGEDRASTRSEIQVIMVASSSYSSDIECSGCKNAVVARE